MRASARASRITRSRSIRATSGASCEVSVSASRTSLSATSRSRARSNARQTVPIPPLPSRPRSSKRPSITICPEVTADSLEPWPAGMPHIPPKRSGGSLQTTVLRGRVEGQALAQRGDQLRVQPVGGLHLGDDALALDLVPRGGVEEGAVLVLQHLRPALELV